MISLFQKSKHVKFDPQSLFEGHQQVTYRGVKTTKCPFDYVMYQMLIWELKPDLVIEIGTNRGGTALYFADLLGLIGKGEVHTIDIQANQPHPVLKHNPRIRLFNEGYQGYELSLAKDFETVLVIEDGSHQYEDTLAAMEKFHDIVTPGSYMIIEDGIIDALNMTDQYSGGPLRAIRDFLPRHPEFSIDRKWCDMFGKNATFNVDGYLRKSR